MFHRIDALSTSPFQWAIDSLCNCTIPQFAAPPTPSLLNRLSPHECMSAIGLASCISTWCQVCNCWVPFFLSVPHSLMFALSRLRHLAFLWMSHFNHSTPSSFRSIVSFPLMTHIGLITSPLFCDALLIASVCILVMRDASPIISQNLRHLWLRSSICAFLQRHLNFGLLLSIH